MRDFKSLWMCISPQFNKRLMVLFSHPVNEPIRIGTHETMFKWKPQEKNTVDFLMKKRTFRRNPGFKAGPPAWRLYVQEKGNYFLKVKFHSIGSTMNLGLRMVRSLNVYVHPWEEPMWWKPLKRRTDKTHPIIEEHSIERS
jgi:hypothetical protein